MKAEHRKELETNVLAQQLGRAIEGLKRGPSRSTVLFIAAVAAVVVIVLLFRYFMASSEATSSKRWLELDEAVFPEQIESFLKEPDTKDTPQGRLALFRDARLHLARGLLVLGSNHEEAQKHLMTATETYADLANKTDRVELLHQEALAGAAKGYEALGQTDDAIKYYKRLVEEYPKSVLGKEAQTQLERLEDPANRAELAAMKKAFSSTRGKNE